MTKVCILAAGRGSRVELIEGLHKALLPINNRPMLSHIFDSIPLEFEIVMAVGYEKDQIKNYVNFVFPERKVKYVDVENFDGPDSGPGLSLLACRDELECPFIFMPVDTYTPGFYFSQVNRNWIGSAEIANNQKDRYCLIDGSETLNRIGYGIGTRIFNGIAGIFDFKEFWRSLADKTLIKNEHQVVNGFKNLKNVKIKIFENFYDTGNMQSYENVKKIFSQEVVLPKASEVIYIDNHKVIKYFVDSDKSKKRAARAATLLKNFVPFVTELNENFYGYPFVKGATLSEVYSKEKLVEFLEFVHNNLYSHKYEYDETFRDDCWKMYHDKTVERSNFYANSPIDRIEKINGVKTPSVENLIARINWDNVVSHAIPRLIHGDLQPENVLVSQEFVLIDWRESFGDSLHRGDVYYDLSKLYHAILINGTHILNGNFDLDIGDNEVFLNFSIKNNLFELYEQLALFCKKYDYDWDHIRFLGALHYINIAPFYADYQDGKYSKFIFLLGKYLLTNYNKKGIITQDG